MRCTDYAVHCRLRWRGPSNMDWKVGGSFMRHHGHIVLRSAGRKYRRVLYNSLFFRHWQTLSSDIVAVRRNQCKGVPADRENKRHRTYIVTIGWQDITGRGKWARIDKGFIIFLVSDLCFQNEFFLSPDIVVATIYWVFLTAYVQSGVKSKPPVFTPHTVSQKGRHHIFVILSSNIFPSSAFPESLQ